MLTLYRAIVFNLHLEAPAHAHITSRFISLSLLAAIFYVTAKLAPLRDDQEQRPFRALFSFAGTLLVSLLIWSESPDPWMAALFLAAGIILALVGRRWNLADLTYHEHLLALAAVLRTLAYNNRPGYYGYLSVRTATVCVVAAGLYAISRRATLEDARHALASAYLHTTSATFLLALSTWYEARTGWLAVFWAVFAFVLAAIDRRFEFDDLRWQAHALAALTMLRCVAVNMYVEDAWHGLSVRLLSLSIVAVIFYLMSGFIRMPAEWRARDFHHIYSWCASLLVSLLLARTAASAPEHCSGLRRFWPRAFRIRVAPQDCAIPLSILCGECCRVFVRIFFANLTADEPGVFWGPRMYTVLPLVLIFFFVYAQLPESEQEAAPDRRLRFDSFVAYLGTATLAALFYFQFDPEWVVTSYAALAFLLFAAAWILHRPIFLHQGILLTLGVEFARGMTHNLFGGGYTFSGDWKGSDFIVGSTVAILLATLFFAFPLRESYQAPPNAVRRNRLLAALVSRPEQLQFFVPVILATTLLALKMREGMVTVSWGIEGVLIILLALAVKERSFRLTGLGTLVSASRKCWPWMLGDWNSATATLLSSSLALR